jgi:ectoine hydroxylase-related dioxygenase (phytanoyl-CoA dioxygenase family)
VWLAIDDVDVENGCMQFAHGSHLQGPLPHERKEDAENILGDGQYVPLDRFDARGAREVELKAGQCSVHDGWLVHGSTPNLSDRRRIGYTSIFVPTATALLPMDMSRNRHAFDDWRAHGIPVVSD